MKKAIENLITIETAKQAALSRIWVERGREFALSVLGEAPKGSKIKTIISVKYQDFSDKRVQVLVIA